MVEELIRCPLKAGYNNYVEALAAKAGLEWCVQQGITDCVLEMDSPIIVEMLKKGHCPILKLKPVFDEILQISTQVNCRFQHCYREANSVADSLAKDVADRDSPVTFSSLNELPDGAKICYQLDKSQLPCIELGDVSGGELQKFAIAVVAIQNAEMYMFDEPSSYLDVKQRLKAAQVYLDSEQRIVASKVVKRFILHTKRTAFIVELDFIMATNLADRIIVYEGKTSIDCIANTPQSLLTGMDLFLSHLNNYI